jgi:protein SCO1/2
MTPAPIRRSLLAGGAVALIAQRSAAAPQGEVTALPPAVREVDIEEQLGRKLDPNLRFVDSSGQPVALGDYFDGRRPVLLTLAYFRCPMLCGLVLRGLTSALRDLDLSIGAEYRAVTISFDPSDRPSEAAAKQATTLQAVGGGAAVSDWPFLTGTADSVRAVVDAVGFRIAYDERSKQYAHPAGVMVLTADGRISRYLYGTQFVARDVKLALVEAGEGKVGTIIDRVLLTCYRFDPAARKFAPFIRGFMRIGGAAILIAVVSMVAVLFRIERRTRAMAERPE